MLERRTRVLGRDHPDTLAALNEISIFFWRVGKYQDQEEATREVWERSLRVLGHRPQRDDCNSR